MHEHHFIDTGSAYVCDECGEVSPDPYMFDQGIYADAIKNQNRYQDYTTEFNRHLRDQYFPAIPKIQQIPGMNTCFWTKRDINQYKLTHATDPRFFNRVWIQYTTNIKISRKYITTKKALIPFLNYFQLELSPDQITYICEVVIKYTELYKTKVLKDVILMALYLILIQANRSITLPLLFKSPFPSSKKTCFHILHNFIEMGFSVDPTQIILNQIPAWLSQLRLPSQWIYPIAKILHQIQVSHLSSGCSLVGITSAIIYLYCHVQRCENRSLPAVTQAAVARMMGMTEVTLRNNLRRFGKFVISPKTITTQVCLELN